MIITSLKYYGIFKPCDNVSTSWHTYGKQGTSISCAHELPLHTYAEEDKQVPFLAYSSLGAGMFPLFRENTTPLSSNPLGRCVFCWDEIQNSFLAFITGIRIFILHPLYVVQRTL